MAQKQAKSARASKSSQSPRKSQSKTADGANSATSAFPPDPDITPGLSDRYIRFIDAYFANGFNLRRAAITAGYSPVGAHVEAHRLVRDPLVRTEIDRRMRLHRIAGDEILARLSIQARADMDDFLDDNGDLDLTLARQRGVMPAVKSLTITETPAGVKRTRIELYSAQDALKTMGHAANILRDNIAVQMGKSLADALGADDPTDPLDPFA